MKKESTPLPELRQRFLKWYHTTSFGRIMQTIEASYLKSSLKPAYNHEILQIGQLGSERLYVDSDFMSAFTLITDSPVSSLTGARQVMASPDELPIASESIDALILPHIIEFETNKHQILREVERILKPEGRLFILGFNPWSPHGIIQYLPRRSSFWSVSFVSRYRLLDWLSLLKFDAEFNAAFNISASRVLSKPTTAWARARAGLSFGYAIKAVKRRYALIPLEPRWISVTSLAAGHMFENYNRPVTSA